MVEMFDVTGSSRIVQFGYDAEAAVVYVRFTDGTPWCYRGVPQETWEEFVRAPSKGRFINEVLNHYDYGRGDF
jgi:hypothetical protein